jgi:hypothetical protein
VNRRLRSRRFTCVVVGPIFGPARTAVLSRLTESWHVLHFGGFSPANDGLSASGLRRLGGLVGDRIVFFAAQTTSSAYELVVLDGPVVVRHLASSDHELLDDVGEHLEGEPSGGPFRCPEDEDGEWSSTPMDDAKAMQRDAAPAVGALRHPAVRRLDAEGMVRSAPLEMSSTAVRRLVDESVQPGFNDEQTPAMTSAFAEHARPMAKRLVECDRLVDRIDQRDRRPPRDDDVGAKRDLRPDHRGELHGPSILRQPVPDARSLHTGLHSRREASRVLVRLRLHQRRRVGARPIRMHDTRRLDEDVGDRHACDPAVIVDAEIEERIEQRDALDATGVSKGEGASAQLPVFTSMP